MSTPTATAATAATAKVKIESPTALQTCDHVPVPREEAEMARANDALCAYHGHMISAVRAVESNACDANDRADEAMELIVKLQKMIAKMQKTMAKMQTTITQQHTTITQLTDRIKAVEEDDDTDDEDYKRRVQDARKDIAKSVLEQVERRAHAKAQAEAAAHAKAQAEALARSKKRKRNGWGPFGL